MLTDGEIIKRCQSGQMDLFDLLIERYKTKLFGFCIKLTGKTFEAEDLFQDTWVKVMRNLNNYNDNGKFLAWLFKICVNLYKDGYRKKKIWLKRFVSFFEEEDFVDLKNVATKAALQDDFLEKSQLELILSKALSRLEDKFKLPVILYYFKEIELKEIAAILNIPEGTVKSRLFKGRELLKNQLGEDYAR